jgi:hypothetical protein
MATRIIRVYEEEDSHILGWNPGAATTLDHPSFVSFMAGRGYTYGISSPNYGRPGDRHIQVRPIMHHEHLAALGRLCTGQPPTDGQPYHTIVYSYPESFMPIVTPER